MAGQEYMDFTVAGINHNACTYNFELLATRKLLEVSGQLQDNHVAESRNVQRLHS